MKQLNIPPLGQLWLERVVCLSVLYSCMKLETNVLKFAAFFLALAVQVTGSIDGQKDGRHEKHLAASVLTGVILSVGIALFTSSLQSDPILQLGAQP